MTTSTTTTSTTDVLIVGAGPAGLTLAADLLRRGIAVRLIDQAAAPSATSRATSLTSRTLEVLDDLGVASAVLDTGIRITDTEAYQGGHRTFRISFPDSDTTRFPFLLNNSQRETERVLTDLVTAHGGRVERERPLTGFRQDRDGVVAQVGGPGGDVEVIRAAWMVGADGGRSTVRRTLGVPFSGDSLEETIVLADVLVDWDLPADRLYSWFNADGALLAFPFTEPERWRITAALSPAETADGRFVENSVDRFTELYRRRTGDTSTRFRDMQGFSVYRVNQRLADQYRRGRVLLAGDAAHVHTPAGGFGMNTGIQDAYSLGWRLALAVRGGDERLVDEYERERRPVAEALLGSTNGLQRLYGIRHRTAQRARDTLLQFLLDLGPLRRAFFARAGQLDITYSTARGLPWSTGARVGDRAPDGPARTWPGGGVTRLHDHLRGTQPTLVVLEGHPAGRGHRDLAVLNALAGQVAASGTPVVRVVAAGSTVATSPVSGVTLVDGQDVLHRRFGTTAPTAVLIRPDGHIARIAGRSGAAGIRTALRSMLLENEREPNPNGVLLDGEGASVPATVREGSLSAGSNRGGCR